MGTLYKVCEATEIRRLASLLERPPGLADRGVEFGPFLGLVLGFEEAADGAEAVWAVRRP